MTARSLVKLEFSEDRESYTAAENLVRIARQLTATSESDRLRDELERLALDHLASDQRELSRVNNVLTFESSSWIARLSSTWHRFWGPNGR